MQNFPDIRNALDFSRSFLFFCGLFRFVSVAAGGLHFPMQYIRRCELTSMSINKIWRYLRSCLQRFYNTFGTNDAKLLKRAIFMPHFPTQYVWMALLNGVYITDL